MNRTALFSIIIILLCVTLCSCSQKNNEPDVVHRAYTSVDILFSTESDTISIRNVIKRDSEYYVLTQETNESDTGFEEMIRIHKVSGDGTITESIDGPDDINYYVSMDITAQNELFYVTMDNKAKAFDLDSGETTTLVESSEPLCGIISCEDGYVLMQIGKICKYGNDGSIKSIVENPEWKNYTGTRVYYEYEDESYLLAGESFASAYYRVDFDNSGSECIYSPYQENRAVRGISGQFFFDIDGLYKLDQGEQVVLAKWNDIDLMPRRFTTGGDPLYFASDEDRFAIAYNYNGPIAELVIYEYDPSANIEDREPIVIGGYNCRNDDMLNWAVYKFNTSQDRYRAIIEDYAIDYGGEDITESAALEADLIKRFNEGDCPDIFYGNEFDYEALYSSGITESINPYLQDEDDLLSGVTDSIRQLMIDSEGDCYRLFPCYAMQGYVTDLDLYESRSDMTIEDVNKLAEERNVRALYPEADLTILYSIIQGAIDHGDISSENDIESLLYYAVTNGYPYGSFYNSPSDTAYTVNENVIVKSTIFSLSEFYSSEISNDSRLQFVGIPGVTDSYHVVVPGGQMALSSGASNPEACVDLMTLMICDAEIQRLSFCNWMLPVNESILDECISYSVDQESVPEDDTFYRIYLNYQDDISEESVEDLLRAVDSADTVLSYDWGLMSIIENELYTYHNSGKSIEETAESLFNRLTLYREENYG